jgi:hypothetical protein
MYRVEAGVLQERNAASAFQPYPRLNCANASTTAMRSLSTSGRFQPITAGALRTKCAAATSREPSPFLRNGSVLWMTPNSIDC